ncbi:arginase family protein [Picrophilus oshimae]|uniref:arginase family protein n=1 Tax=Picrophilus oshimae TaxID=46632 RepID=UPI000A04F2AC|nr:arginase family protein [Picrophilus oshimae]
MSFNDPRVLKFSEVNKNSENPDIVITGVPYDGVIISHRRGARYGPERIREIMNSYSSYCTDHNVDLNSLKILDAGNIDVNFIDYNIEKIKDDYYNIIKKYNSRFIAMGGDHSITEGLFKSVCKLNKKTGMILFDAHHDIRDPWRVNSGSWGK